MSTFNCCLIVFSFWIMLWHSCSSCVGTRHKRRRHQKSLDRETSLWRFVLTAPLCCPSANPKLKKKNVLCHIQTTVLCYTVFCHVMSVWELCKSHILIWKELTKRAWDTYTHKIGLAQWWETTIFTWRLYSTGFWDLMTGLMTSPHRCCPVETSPFLCWAKHRLVLNPSHHGHGPVFVSDWLIYAPHNAKIPYCMWPRKNHFCCVGLFWWLFGKIVLFQWWSTIYFIWTK